MTDLFYLLTILLLWTELSCILSPVKNTRETKKLYELSKKFKDKNWDEYSEEFKNLLKSKAKDLFIVIWLFIGLFTSQWILFLAYILFSVLIMFPLMRLTKFTMSYTALNWISSLVGFCFGIFIIINHYHLKINLTELFF